MEEEKVGALPAKIEIIEVSGMDQYSAVLWVPDPEQRHGWREYYVRKGNNQPKPGARGMGF